MAYLELNNISKTYNKNNIIKNINLHVEKGEFVVIVGPSGCGKSSLLRMIAGLEEVTKGDIFLSNKLINDVTPADRDIAMVFQNYALYPHMNVEQNLSYGLKNRKINKEIILEKVKNISKILQIEELLKRKPNELSGGQKQRVAMGRAIIREPKIFLFDEPLSNLDAKLRHKMRIEIRKLHDKLGITSIYVTHDQVEAMTLADKIVLINNGIIEQIGTPSEIYKEPKTVFVSKFMGSPPMNIIELKVENNCIKIDNKTHMLKNVIDENKIFLGIKAEDISFKDFTNSIKINIYIDMIEHLGAESLIYTKIENTQIIIKCNVFIEFDIKNIDIYLNPDKFYFFSFLSEKIIK